MNAASYGSTSILDVAQYAIIDTGTPFLAIPSTAYATFKTQIVTELGSLIDCNVEKFCTSDSQCSYLATMLSQITLTIDSTDYAITPAQYLMSDYKKFNCIVAIAEETSSDDYFVLGGAFLR